MNWDSDDSVNSNVSFVDNFDILACTEYTNNSFIVEKNEYW